MEDLTSKCTTFYQIFAFNSYEHNSTWKIILISASLPLWILFTDMVILPG